MSNPAPSKTSCVAVFKAADASSSIHFVRAIPAALAPGDDRSSNHSARCRPKGNAAMRYSHLRPPRRKRAASGSKNNREREGRDDSSARKSAMYSAVRLARLVTKDPTTIVEGSQGGPQALQTGR